MLADALAVCEGMEVNVEIKNEPDQPGHDPEETVAALTALAISEAGWTDRVIVSSFQISTLRAVQAADGRLTLGALWGLLDRHQGCTRPGRRGGLVGHPPLCQLGQCRTGGSSPRRRLGRQRLDRELR